MADPRGVLKSYCEKMALSEFRKDDQKKIQLEQILLRPDTYIGSVEPVTQRMWVFDEDVGLNCRDVTFVPGVYKIFDEILVNAANNKQRDSSTTCININIDPGKNSIRVWNNGKGIPVVQHKVEKVFLPAIVFGQLITSSSGDDDQEKVTGGGNGYGAKLCNIFSTKFKVKTGCSESKASFEQTWFDNMSRAGKPKIKPFRSKDYTSITFQPDLAKFQMQSLDRDIVALMTRRAYDVAGSCQGVRVLLNNTRLPVDGFRSYVDLYVKDKVDETGSPLTVVHEVVNPRWEVCLTVSEKGFQQVSFINSIATTQGGTHIDYVTDQIVSKLIEAVKKKIKAGVAVEPFQVKDHIWLFVNCLIENPSFDSPTKENMILQQTSFGSTCTLSDDFLQQADECGVVESVTNWITKFTTQTYLNENRSAVKLTKIYGVPKLDDATDAGGENSAGCTLIVTEGDEAKALVVSGLGVMGHDRYGVFPLECTMLNVRGASQEEIVENADIRNIMKILGLQYCEDYSDPDSLKSLRYGKVLIVMDRILEDSNIKGLLINFFHHNWPSLLRHHFLEMFVPPIIKVSCKNQELSFYSIPEFTEWKEQQSNLKSWNIKCYKGLGTITAKEAKEYFSDLARHCVPFKYSGSADDEAITVLFNKKKQRERREWLTRFMANSLRRREDNLPEEHLYGKNTSSITYRDFINNELGLFWHSSFERFIPCLVDGLKSDQRKVLFCCFKRNDKKEVNVAQLAGSVAEMSYHQPREDSLTTTIVGLAQNFVGSNNLNLLQPLGQFGTRLLGGKDQASPRRLFTMLSSLTRLLFPSVDDNLLSYKYEGNVRVEPMWYIPIIPLVLANGVFEFVICRKCIVPSYDVRDIINNLHRMLNGEEPLPMIPSYKSFKGSIEELGFGQYMISGVVEVIDSTTIEISELPVKMCTQAYKQNVLEVMLHGSENGPALITDYEELHTDTSVRFMVKMTEENLQAAVTAGLHRVFRLQNLLTCNNMILFDHEGRLKTYAVVQDVLREFFELRLKHYVLRKNWLMELLEAERTKLFYQICFILQISQGSLVLENRPKQELIRTLQDMGYVSDPVGKVRKQEKEMEEEAWEDDEQKEEQASGPDYDYLLKMPLWFLTKEKVEELRQQREAKLSELNLLKNKTPQDLWREDLAAFTEELERVEQAEKESQLPVTQVTGGGGGAEEVQVRDRAAEKADGEKGAVRAESEGSGVEMMMMMVESEDEEAGQALETEPAPPLTEEVKEKSTKKKGKRKRCRKPKASAVPEESTAVPDSVDSPLQPPPKKKKAAAKRKEKRKEKRKRKA